MKGNFLKLPKKMFDQNFKQSNVAWTICSFYFWYTLLSSSIHSEIQNFPFSFHSSRYMKLFTMRKLFSLKACIRKHKAFRSVKLYVLGFSTCTKLFIKTKPSLNKEHCVCSMLYQYKIPFILPAQLIIEIVYIVAGGTAYTYTTVN